MVVPKRRETMGILKMAVTLGTFIIVIGMGSAIIVAVIAYTKGDLTLKDFQQLVQNITTSKP